MPAISRRSWQAGITSLVLCGILYLLIGQSKLGATGNDIVDTGDGGFDWSFGLRRTTEQRRRQRQELLSVYHHHEIWDQGLYGQHTKEVLRRVARCLDGDVSCPPRPIILSNYQYLRQTLEGNPPGGEIIWLDSVLRDVEKAGYEVIVVHEYEPLVLISRLMPSLIHLVWAEQFDVTSCVADPRCIQDFQTPYVDDPWEESRPEGNLTEHSILVEPGRIEEILPHERGSIPLSRLITTTWWANFPELQFQADDYDGPGSEAVPYNPLGNCWQWAPFAYPGHTLLPWGIERICHSIDWVPHEEREHSALIYSKWTSVFYRYVDSAFWASEALTKLKYKLYATAIEDEGKVIPAGIDNLGIIPRVEFARLLSHVRVLIGIGAPAISPSPYVALCQGVPVVMPTYNQEPFKTQWDIYNGAAQHGPVLQMKPPYVYQYWIHNTTELVDAIQSAIENPIESYVPPEMTEAYTAQKVKELLTTDWDDLARVEISKRGREATRPMLRTTGPWEHPSWSKKISSAAIERIESELPGHV